jgi:hypothetical protein
VLCHAYWFAYVNQFAYGFQSIIFYWHLMAVWSCPGNWGTEFYWHDQISISKSSRTGHKLHKGEITRHVRLCSLRYRDWSHPGEQELSWNIALGASHHHHHQPASN